MTALEIDDQAAVAMIETGRLPCPLDVTCRERLPLFVNVLARLETRFRHDSAKIRRAIEQRLDMLRASPSPACWAALSTTCVRCAVDATAALSKKWYRINH